MKCNNSQMCLSYAYKNLLYRITLAIFELEMTFKKFFIPQTRDAYEPKEFASKHRNLFANELQETKQCILQFP